MGFGNPYGDPYSEDIVYTWVKKMEDLGVNIISVADTVGLATPEQVQRVVRYLIDASTSASIGVHLHSSPENLIPKIKAAYQAGCRRFDGAIKGIGGCPMANDDLVGNMNTEVMIRYFTGLNVLSPLNQEALDESIRMADELFKLN
jgi:hydroxymethylglutaryl-CoA lyase